MKVNFIIKHFTPGWCERIAKHVLAVIAFVLSFSFMGRAQDAAVVPANDNTKVAWVNGATFTGLVTQSSSGWTNPGNIVDNSDVNYGSVAYSGAGTKTTPAVSISNNQAYNTTAFTGYRIGVVASRTKSGISLWNALGSNKIRITTYKSGSQVEQAELDWRDAITDSSVDSDVGEYFRKPFDEVRVVLISSVTGGSGEQRLKQVYLQRYTRGAAGTSGVEATCNAQVPVTGRGIIATGVSSGLGVPPYIVPALPWMIEAMEDLDPATHATFPMITTFFALGTRYEGSVKDEAVVYPAGTYAGFKLTIGAGFGTNAADIRVLNLKRNGTVVSTSSTVGLLGAAVLNTDGSTTIGMIATAEFDEIEYSVTTLLSPTPGASAVEVHYPVIQRFCDAPISCTSPPAPINLKKGIQGGATNYPVWVKATLPLSIGTLNGTVKDVDNVIDNDPDNFALISQLVSGITDYGISVTSQEEAGYPAGTYVGFELEDVDVVSAGAAIVHTISTYLDGSLVQSYTDGAVVGGKVFNTTGRNLVGFKTTEAFDEVRISITSAAAGGLYGTRVYNAVIESFCASTTPPVCNTVVPLTRNSYAAYVDATNTGINSAASVQNTINHTDRLIDSDLTNYATITTLASGTVSASVAVQNGGDVYPVGTFAGFDISNPNLAGGGFLNNIEISTLNASGGVVETVNASGSLFAIASSLLTGTGRQTIGFLSTQPFTGVKLTFNKTVTGELGEIRVYNAVTETFCVDDVLACGELTPVTNPGFPVYVDSRQTGFFGVASAGNAINNSQSAIDADASTYASVTLGAALGTSASFAVANAKETYPSGTYAGFDIESQSLFNAGVLSSMSITLYNDGLAVQNTAGTALLGGITSSIVTGGYSRGVVGVVGHFPFDEVKITFTNGAAVNLGTIRIYNAVFQPFLNMDGTQFCPVEIDCKGNVLGGSTVPGAKTISAVVNYEHTGVTGVAAAGYAVENPWNVVSADPTDFARIYNAASGATQASLSVATPNVVYPVGTIAGFTIKKNPLFLSGAAFPFFTVTTYLNGVQQETKTSGALADFSLFVQWFGTPTDFYNPGFKATLPFDEVSISVGSLVSVADHYVDVYGAYVDTRESVPTSGSTPIVCAPDLTVSDLAFYPNANISSPTQTRNLVVKILELNDVATDPSLPIEVRITRPSGFTITYDGGATSVSSQSVNNQLWERYNVTSTSYVYFRYIGASFAKSSTSSIGLSFKATSSSTLDGNKPIIATILNGSNETNIENNSNGVVLNVSIP